MNGLAFEHYVDLPWLIFHGWNAQLVNEHLTDSVVGAINSKRSLDAITVARLRWYPSLFSNFILAGQVSRPDIEAVVSADFSTRYRVMTNHYDELAPLLEAPLLQDPESAERIIRFRRYKNKPTFRPEEEYLASLGDDPNRHYRLTPPGQRPDREVMSAQANERKYSNPAWAYMYVSCTSVAALEEELSQVIMLSEEYAYLTALILRKRGLPSAAWEHLLTGIKSERWAFHVLRDLAPGTELSKSLCKRLADVLHRSPPWAVQYWVACGFRGDVLHAGYEACARISANHETAPELHSWYRFMSATEGKRVAA